ncbi:MAG: 23S rRNA (adenine(2503)-C(2))-methyltransferase RlmN [Bacteroidales bacterium]|nr:23S rRNA (adenine(2503)-C(2))-methyltransferase RlmN [Bacteroidales bacterium]
MINSSIKANKTSLFGKTLDELKKVAKELGMPAFTAKQMSDWLYKKKIFSIDEMSNLSKKNRDLLAEKYEIGLREPVSHQESTDGTKKYLFNTQFGKYIETAYIPDKERKTLCVSSQVGCKMGCIFCETGRQGLQGNLTAGEILNQLKSLPEGENISNIVYMGMGEPFDNTEEVIKSIEILTSEWGFAMSPRRITVSTIGIIPGMKEFLSRSEAHLAISLHSPFEEERMALMPAERKHSFIEILKEIKNWDFSGQRRVSFEYIVFDGLNDTPKHVQELAKILNGINCRINLIRFHEIPATQLKSTNEKRLLQFQKGLKEKKIITTIRSSRGQDIYAACGLLSTRTIMKK